MSMLAFCPWLRLDAGAAVGPFELVPFKRGEAPFGAGSDDQAIADAILEPYVNEPGKPIDRAVLVRRSFEYASRDHYRLFVQAFNDAQDGVSSSPVGVTVVRATTSHAAHS